MSLLLNEAAIQIPAWNQKINEIESKDDAALSDLLTTWEKDYYQDELKNY